MSETIINGTVNIGSGGSSSVLTSAIVVNGGTLNVMGTDSSGIPYGTATSITVDQGGSVNVSGGATISSAIINGGTLTLLREGKAIDTDINADGRLVVEEGADSTNANISAHGLAVVSAVSGSASYISSPTVFSGGIVSANGLGAIITSGTISSGGTAILTSDASLSTVTISGFLSAGSGTVVNNTPVYGVLSASNATVLGIIANDHASVTLDNGTQGNFDSVNSDATFLVTGQGTTENSGAVSGNGVMSFTSGAVGSSISATAWNSGDTPQIIVSSGAAVYDTSATGSGADITLADKASSYNATVSSGASIVVQSGAMASDSVIDSGGILNVASGGILSGLTTLQNGGSATIYANAGGTIQMDGSTNTGLTISGLTSGGTVTTQITDFDGTAVHNSDGITLAGIHDGDITAVNVSGDTVTLTLKNSETPIVLDIVGASSHGYQLVAGGDGSLIYEVCFLAGSMIRTASGEVAVEDIRLGDEILTYDWKNNCDVTRPVVWAGKSHATVRTDLPDDEAGWPVRVTKNAIADGVPYKDMLITAEHCLFFDGKFVPVRMLVNGISIFYDKSITSYDYYHVETEQHAVITADGMLTESYLDTGNRRSFQQAGQVVVLRPAAVRSWNKDAAAPLCVDRAFVESLFQSLKSRNNSLDFSSVSVSKTGLTNDPDLHLMTDTGAVVRPMRKTAHEYSFMLPPFTQSVRIVSRASRPSDVIGPFVDDRRYMGVAVADIHLLCAKQKSDITSHLQTEKPEGWYETDWTDCAWTNGDAELPLGNHLAHGKMGILSMVIRAAGPYIVDNQKEAKTAKSA